jgi:hypothetical protein
LNGRLAKKMKNTKHGSTSDQVMYNFSPFWTGMS